MAITCKAGKKHFFFQLALGHGVYHRTGKQTNTEIDTGKLAFVWWSWPSRFYILDGFVGKRSMILQFWAGKDTECSQWTAILGAQNIISELKTPDRDVYTVQLYFCFVLPTSVPWFFPLGIGSIWLVCSFVCLFTGDHSWGSWTFENSLNLQSIEILNALGVLKFRQCIVL